MTESDTPTIIVEAIPSVQGEVSAVASATAPFIYFDNASTFGINEGVANITLEANRVMVVGGEVRGDRVIVAHVRMSVGAIARLKSAIEGIDLQEQKGESGERTVN
ncbi:hypothetical protein [Microvirga antarctica]|uniref:hypothetical protein n=1 Tax=Microvirga antarctica TaxID=2819233 RepID=UPI001B3055B0|nr:hypothetical protein [Microvirga antarctica]